MNFVVITSDDSPDKHASAIRHTTVCKGLVKLGHTVTFLYLEPQLWGEKPIDYLGIHSVTVNNYNGYNKFLKMFHWFRGITKANKWIRQESKRRKIDAVIIYSIEIPPLYLIIKQAKKLNIKVFHERTELPYASVIDSNRQHRQLDYYLKKLLPKFDGVFVINDKLGKYIQQFNPDIHKLLTVVDLSFFKTDKPNPYPFKYIGYCGQIWGDKDGVPILIEAFSKITNSFPDHKLLLIGNNSHKNLIKPSLDAIERLNLSDKVVFSGLVDRELMPVLLCNAEILAVSKPDNERNTGNFPIKIGEYLATGVPVVVTKVGEIPDFIKDGESGFLAVPGSADSFAEKMKEALSDRERAVTMGKKGQQVAAKYFDYMIQAKVMADYIAEINNKK